jgi:hypothetical protein
MSPKTRTLLIALGAVTVVGAGAAGYLFLVPPAAPKVVIVEFIGAKRATSSDVDARAAPNASASVSANLHRGVAVTVNGLVDGRDWAEIELPDKRIAYVPSSAVAEVVAGPPASTASTAAPPPPTAADLPVVSSDAVATPVEFDRSESLYRVTATTGAYVEPARGAPQKYPVEAGTLVQALATTKDGNWVWVDTQDHAPAFLAVADLTVAKDVQPDEPPPGPTLPDFISGKAVVVDSGSVTVKDQQVSLAGVQGEGGAFGPQLQQLIASRGGSVQCKRVDQKYICVLPPDLDIGRVALFNGLARPAEDASPDYLAQADAARTARRGVWASGGN